MKRTTFTTLLSVALITPACLSTDDESFDLEEVAEDEASREHVGLDTDRVPASPRGLSASEVANDGDHNWIRGELLHEIRLEHGHRIQFWEIEPGEVLAYELAPAPEDGDPPTRLSNLPENHSLTVLDLYRIAQPEAEDDDIPTEIVEAAAREQERWASTHEFLAPDEFDEEAQVSHTGMDDLTADPDPQLACSPDLLGDNWGANWFLSNYCVSGAFRWCPTNVQWAYTGYEYSSWYQLSGMAADFWNGARIAGSHWAGFYWQADYDIPIFPRWIQTITYNGWGWRKATLFGDPGCMRVHLAKKHNN